MVYYVLCFLSRTFSVRNLCIFRNIAQFLAQIIISIMSRADKRWRSLFPDGDGAAKGISGVSRWWFLISYQYINILLVSQNASEFILYLACANENETYIKDNPAECTYLVCSAEFS